MTYLDAVLEAVELYIVSIATKFQSAQSAEQIIMYWKIILPPSMSWQSGSQPGRLDSRMLAQSMSGGRVNHGSGPSTTKHEDAVRERRAWFGEAFFDDVPFKLIISRMLGRKRKQPCNTIWIGQEGTKAPSRPSSGLW